MSQWLDDFVTTVLDEGMYVAGGACRDRAVGLDPQHDVDLFVRDENALVVLKARLEDAGYLPVFACPKGELFTYRLPNESGWDHLSDDERAAAEEAEAKAIDAEAAAIDAEELEFEAALDAARSMLNGPVFEFQKKANALKDALKVKGIGDPPEPMIQPDSEFGLKPDHSDIPERKNWTGLPVHVVCKEFYPDVKTLLHSFDFTCCMFGWSKETGYVEGSSLALQDAKGKVLRMNRLTYPVATMRRTTKFVKYGYKMAEGFWQGLYAEIKNGNFPEDFLVYSLD